MYLEGESTVDEAISLKVTNNYLHKVNNSL